VLKDLQRAILRALAADDPAQALGRTAAALSEDDRGHLACVGPDGLRITARLVRKQRIERICRGGDDFSAWLQADPEAFLTAYRAYEPAVPATRYFPSDEAQAFRKFLAARGGPGPASPPRGNAPA